MDAITEQVEVAAQAIHDAICKDRTAPWSECTKPVLEAATDAVLALRDAGHLTRA